MPDLCAFHEHAATACLAKTGHHDDGATAARLRADLARACTPRWCATTRPEPKEHR